MPLQHLATPAWSDLAQPVSVLAAAGYATQIDADGRGARVIRLTDGAIVTRIRLSADSAGDQPSLNATASEFEVFKAAHYRLPSVITHALMHTLSIPLPLPDCATLVAVTRAIDLLAGVDPDALAVTLQALGATTGTIHLATTEDEDHVAAAWSVTWESNEPESTQGHAAGLVEIRTDLGSGVGLNLHQMAITRAAWSIATAICAGHEHHCPSLRMRMVDRANAWNPLRLVELTKGGATGVAS